MSAQQLPLFEPDGVTHTGDCPCPPCDEERSGAEPTRRGRAEASSETPPSPRRRSLSAEERSQAEATLARRRVRRRSKALALSLELEEEERRTRARIDALTAQAVRVSADDRLEALLARRRAGVAPDEAIAEVEAKAETRGRRAR